MLRKFFILPISLLMFFPLLSCDAKMRLSAIVNFANDDPKISKWLAKPNKYYLEAFVRFDKDLSPSTIFGIDQELVEGIENHQYIKGGDWMGLIGLQRNGKIWVATGTPETENGKPSKDRKFEFYDIGHELKPDTWYRLYSIVDYSKRRFVAFSIDGGGIERTFDLSKHRLDYPNMLVFDKPAMTHLVFALAGDALGTKPNEKTHVYFDDIKGGIIENGNKIKVFEDGFENSNKRFPPQPWNYMGLIKDKKIRTDDFKDGIWYVEREESIGAVINANFAKSGSKIAILDAVPFKTDFESWAKSKSIE